MINFKREAKRRGIRKRYTLRKAELIELLSYFFEVVQETLNWTMGEEYESSWSIGEDVNVKDMTVEQLRDIHARCINVRHMQQNELLDNKISILLDNDL